MENMDPKYAALFTPWKIGNCEIKNRVVMTSMGGTNLLGWMEINHFDKAGAEFIYEVAKNNCGLVPIWQLEKVAAVSGNMTESGSISL